MHAERRSEDLWDDSLHITSIHNAFSPPDTQDPIDIGIDVDKQTLAPGVGDVKSNPPKRVKSNSPLSSRSKIRRGTVRKRAKTEAERDMFCPFGCQHFIKVAKPNGLANLNALKKHQKSCPKLKELSRDERREMFLFGRIVFELKFQDVDVRPAIETVRMHGLKSFNVKKFLGSANFEEITRKFEDDAVLAQALISFTHDRPTSSFSVEQCPLQREDKSPPRYNLEFLPLPERKFTLGNPAQSPLVRGPLRPEDINYFRKRLFFRRQFRGADDWCIELVENEEKVEILDMPYKTNAPFKNSLQFFSGDDITKVRQATLFMGHGVTMMVQPETMKESISNSIPEYHMSFCFNVAGYKKLFVRVYNIWRPSGQRKSKCQKFNGTWALFHTKSKEVWSEYAATYKIFDIEEKYTFSCRFGAPESRGISFLVIGCWKNVNFKQLRNRRFDDYTNGNMSKVFEDLTNLVTNKINAKAWSF